MSELEKFLLEFKKVTLDMEKLIEKEDFDSLDKLIEKRQITINNIEKLKYTKEEFKNICENLDILSEDKKINKLLSEKKEEIKNQMAEINKSQQANKKYNKHLYQNSGVFSTKI
jgi:hypothetical protein